MVIVHKPETRLPSAPFHRGPAGPGLAFQVGALDRARLLHRLLAGHVTYCHPTPRVKKKHDIAYSLTTDDTRSTCPRLTSLHRPTLTTLRYPTLNAGLIPPATPEQLPCDPVVQTLEHHSSAPHSHSPGSAPRRTHAYESDGRKTERCPEEVFEVYLLFVL